MTRKIFLISAGIAAIAATQTHADELDDFVAEANANLAAAGAKYVIEYAEIITPDGSDEQVTRFFNDRGNKQLTADFVPGDTRRAWSGPGGNSITWARNTGFETVDVSSAAQSAAIASAMATWDSKKCSDIGLSGGDLAYGIGPAVGGPVVADIMHSAFLPAGILPPNVLGVTFTFIFIDAPPPFGQPTDINGDGLADTALRDIYYNDAFAWDTTGGNFDIETVALHEAGHGLSQAHFGTAFTNKGGKVHFAPRAVMNAAYSGVQREIKGTDNGGHCSIWGDWPNN